ncbi:helix-turn-helix domain-containing protein [Lactobacillus helveticus]|uniref:helix-turn-helix domain-containing protein n=1 Tax=Lactobacillus helveticus TaxID=1587 RepID=UPI00197BB17B|nr:helix-turn-helix transcriptional regulator [Lactobacillus helveticus]MBN6048735.1 helix-turn-helix transcriptional regulator [Lactobacillus helveticus]
MTIGELLRDYRIKKEKKQKEFVGNIISPSYYSKIEKNKHQISASDLIKILQYNNISITEFFSNFNQADKQNQSLIEKISNLMTEAYYQVNKDKMRNLKKIVQNSDLSKTNKEEQILMIDGFIELLNGNQRSNHSEEVRKKLKEKIFSIPNFNLNKLMLYCNAMRFYNLSDTKLISKNIIHQFSDSENLDIIKRILAIIINILIFSIENEDFKDINFFINTANNIPTNPDLFFYKNVSLFFINFIQYKIYKDKSSLKGCDSIIYFFHSTQMTEYADELSKFKNIHK